MTGIVIGLVAGNIVGFVAEIATGGGKLVMTGGAFAGVSIGGLIDALRFWWRKRKVRELQKS